MIKSTFGKALCLALSVTFGTAQVAQACTGIVLIGQDETMVRARTLEWGAFDLQSSVSLVPAGYEMTAAMPDGATGASWTVQYDFVGATALGKLVFADGINEAGLSGGLFYLPGFAEFPEFDPEHAENSIGPSDVLGFILANFATVDEVRAAFEEIRIVAVVEDALGFPAPVHYTVTDLSGETIVIEVVDQELIIHDAPLGVITNSPPYDWHITNLRNYINLSALELPERTVSGESFAPLGSGSGMIGLPGDFTPPSRFVRAVAFSQSARITEGGYDTVREAFRILDNFNVPPHAVEDGSESDGDEILSATQFTTAAELQSLRFYYHTQFSRQVRVIDLNEIDFDALNGEPKTVPMDEVRDETLVPVTFDQ